MKIVNFAISHSGFLFALCEDGCLYERIADRRSFAGPSGATKWLWKRVEGPDAENIEVTA
jgi:hypothetical protein